VLYTSSAVLAQPVGENPFEFNLFRPPAGICRLSATSGDPTPCGVVLVALGIEHFRTLYRRNGTDTSLQPAMEFHTWNDHETANDAPWDDDRDIREAPDHPFQIDPDFGNDPDRLHELKLNSQQAWSEYVPTRLAFDGSTTNPFEALQIYRRFRFGELVELFRADQRTYRSGHPSGAGAFGERYATRDCDQRHAPDQTMLDDPQLDWLVSSVSASNARWKSWDNQVFLGELTLGNPGAEQIIVNAAAWDNFFLSGNTFCNPSIQSACGTS